MPDFRTDKIMDNFICLVIIMFGWQGAEHLRKLEGMRISFILEDVFLGILKFRSVDDFCTS